MGVENDWIGRARGPKGAIALWLEQAATLIGCNRLLRRNPTAPARPPRARTGATGRSVLAIGRCRRATAALEFAIVATPLMLMTFGFIAVSGIFYTWPAMQSSAQYAALMVATGQINSISTGAITTSNTTATTTCSGSLTSTEAEYYACTGLPNWVTFTVTTTENCATPSVAVSLSTNATAAAIADVFSIFTGKTLVASAVLMKQGQCP